MPADQTDILLFFCFCIHYNKKGCIHELRRLPWRSKETSGHAQSHSGPRASTSCARATATKEIYNDHKETPFAPSSTTATATARVATPPSPPAPRLSTPPPPPTPKRIHHNRLRARLPLRQERLRLQQRHQRPRVRHFIVVVICMRTRCICDRGCPNTLTTCTRTIQPLFLQNCFNNSRRTLRNNWVPAYPWR